jgi:hypothetical protein
MPDKGDFDRQISIAREHAQGVLGVLTRRACSFSTTSGPLKLLGEPRVSTDLQGCCAQ